jgi:hypothetical protein
MANSSQSLEQVLRNLQRTKGTRTIPGEGIPDRKDGNDGEFILRKTQNGVKLYAKYSGEWYGFSPDSDREDSNVLSVDDTKTISDNGSITLTGGFIMKWGNFAADDTSKSVTFPTAFPKKCISVWLTGYLSSDTGGGGAHGIHTLPTTTGFTASVDSSWTTVYWLALGN